MKVLGLGLILGNSSPLSAEATAEETVGGVLG
jgi:hypothetical protein